MQNQLVVAIVSGPAASGNKAANLAIMEQVVTGPARDADLIVFSEANINGGFWRDGESDYPALAEDVPNGPSCQQAIDLAVRHRKAICCGLLERAAGEHFITHLLCGPQGLVGVQRKLFTRPGGFFAPGDQLSVLELCGHRCLILACADILLPEAPIAAALRSTSLVLSPTDCFSESQEGLVRRLLPVRAMDARAPILMAFGHDGTSKDCRLLAGAIVQPNGEFSTLECRTLDETHVIRMTLEIKEPRRAWVEGIRARADILRRHL